MTTQDKRNAAGGLGGSPLSFAQQGYDRCSLQRHRHRYLRNCLQQGTAKLVFVYQRKVGLVHAENRYEAAFVDCSLVPAANRELLKGVFLGEHFGQPVFSVSCDAALEDLLSLSAEPLVFFDLRQATSQLPFHHASLLGYALAMDNWHRTHAFCGSCGSPTESSESGHMRLCTGSDCGRHHFPRTDPAIIVLVESGDSCLLGRKKEWPDRRYSTIAGFVEPGETPEQSVCREVHEETGIRVEAVGYAGAQPWPFPGSLMLGFRARAPRGVISLMDDELQDARWFSREEIAEWVPAGRLRLPTRISIAYRLIEDWYDRGGARLDEINPDT